MKKYIFLFATILLWQACGTSEKETVASVPDESIPVRVTPVHREGVAQPIYGSGILNYDSEQRLSFKIGGVIEKIFVDEGDYIKNGQLLARLNRTEIDANVSKAKQALEKAERDLKRVEGLYRDSSATLELLENATTARDVAAEDLRIAGFNKSYAEIRATRSGRIVKKRMNEGEITEPGMPILVMYEAGNEDWIVSVNVPDRDWARLQTGTPAAIQMDAYPNMNFPGKVSKLAPAADPSNGLYEVEVSVRPQGKRFAPGLFARVTFASTEAVNYPVIPIEALMEGDGMTAFVFAPDEGGTAVQKIPVQVAFIDKRQVYIASGLDNINEVVTAGAPYLNETKTIRIIK